MPKGYANGDTFTEFKFLLNEKLQTIEGVNEETGRIASSDGSSKQSD